MNVQGVDTIFSPLDVAWALDNGSFSGVLKQNMVWLCGLLPYEQAAQVMARIGKRQVSDSSLWRMAQHTEQWLDRPADGEVLDATAVSKSASAEPTTKLLSMDGGMVNIFGEGWKELKVALVGSVVVEEPDPSDSPPTVVHTQPLRYGAVLGDVAAFTPVLLDVATSASFGQATRSCLTADGAPWIWNLADTHFPDSVQILDWYHARQHLSDAAQALFPDQPTLAATWFQTHTDALFEGHLAPIVAELERAHLPEPAAYFRTHAPRTHYADFQERGYPIGSGSVESEVKQFKQRLDGPGMSWSRPGIQHIIRIRAAVLDGSFDARWSQAA
jgi:hypothetical protein